jgi:hypothetical protein
MNLHTASPEQLAREFQRRIEHRDNLVTDPLVQLEKSSLSHIAPLGEYFFDALEAAKEQHSISNADFEASRRLDAALMAIHRYGLSWDPRLLQDRGFELLSQLYEASDSVTRSSLTPAIITVISHLSPKLRIDQITQLLERERNREEISENDAGAVAVDVYSQLAMTSPRQLFLKHAGQYVAADELSRGFEIASMALNDVTERLSDSAASRDLSFPIAFRNAQGAICAVSLLIPELLSVGGELDEQLLDDVMSLTDSLSWMVEAGVLSDPDFFVKHSRIGEPLAGMLFSSLNECRMASWAALSLLLNPETPWAENFTPTRERLCQRAMNILQHYHDRGSSEPGRVAIELFLATADLHIRSDETALANLRAKLLGILESYNDRGVPPYQVDGLTAAVVAWQTVNQGDLDDLFVKELRLSSRSALQGRLFSPRIQEFLVRAAEEER